MYGILACHLCSSTPLVLIFIHKIISIRIMTVLAVSLVTLWGLGLLIQGWSHMCKTDFKYIQ